MCIGPTGNSQWAGTHSQHIGKASVRHTPLSKNLFYKLPEHIKCTTKGALNIAKFRLVLNSNQLI